MQPGPPKFGSCLFVKFHQRGKTPSFNRTKTTRWWFQIFFYFHLYLGKMNPFLTSIFFQVGWFNHRLDNFLKKQRGKVMKPLEGTPLHVACRTLDGGVATWVFFFARLLPSPTIMEVANYPTPLKSNIATLDTQNSHV